MQNYPTHFINALLMKIEYFILLQLCVLTRYKMQLHITSNTSQIVLKNLNSDKRCHPHPQISEYFLIKLPKKCIKYKSPVLQHHTMISIICITLYKAIKVKENSKFCVFFFKTMYLTDFQFLAAILDAILDFSKRHTYFQFMPAV